MKDKKLANSWVKIRPSDLSDATDQPGGIKAFLPNISAIYMWKLRLRPEGVPLNSTAAMMSHVERLARTPQGRVQNVRLSHALQLDGLSLAGDGLGEKQAVFQDLVADPDKNKSLRLYLDALEDHLPALYVGETGRLGARINEHLSGLTDFGSTVIQTDDFDWSELNLYYYRLGDTSDKSNPVRTAIEYLTSTLTISAYTKRPG